MPFGRPESTPPAAIRTRRRAGFGPRRRTPNLLTTLSRLATLSQLATLGLLVTAGIGVAWAQSPARPEAPAALPAAPVPADGDGVLVSLAGPGVPYASVEHEIQARHGTVMVRVTKKFVHRFGHFDRVGLIALDELGPLLAQWFPPGAPPLRAPSPRPGAPAILTLTWTVAGRTQTVRMDWPPPPDAIVAADRARTIQRAVEGLAGTVAYQDAMLLPAESGRVRLRSSPVAWVTVDGLPLGLATPLEAFVLPVGEHEVAFAPVEGGSVRTYPLKVVSGQTTALEVDLR